MCVCLSVCLFRVGAQTERPRAPRLGTPTQLAKAHNIGMVASGYTTRKLGFRAMSHPSNPVSATWRRRGTVRPKQAGRVCPLGRPAVVGGGAARPAQAGRPGLPIGPACCGGRWRGRGERCEAERERLGTPTQYPISSFPSGRPHEGRHSCLQAVPTSRATPGTLS